MQKKRHPVCLSKAVPPKEDPSPARDCPPPREWPCTLRQRDGEAWLRRATGGCPECLSGETRAEWPLPPNCPCLEWGEGGHEQDCRGHRKGCQLTSGTAQEQPPRPGCRGHATTSVPACVLGHHSERLLRAQKAGGGWRTAEKPAKELSSCFKASKANTLQGCWRRGGGRRGCFCQLLQGAALPALLGLGNHHLGLEGILLQGPHPVRQRRETGSRRGERRLVPPSSWLNLRQPHHRDTSTPAAPPKGKGLELPTSALRQPGAALKGATGLLPAHAQGPWMQSRAPGPSPARAAPQSQRCPLC